MLSLCWFICYVIDSYCVYLPFTNKHYWLLVQNSHYKFQLRLTNGRYRRAPTIACAVTQAIVSKTVWETVHQHCWTFAQMIILRDSFRWIMFWLLCYLSVLVCWSDLIAWRLLLAAAWGRLLGAQFICIGRLPMYLCFLGLLVRT